MLKELDAFCKSNGIERQHTIRNEPHQNGVAERANRDIAEHATAMLMEARLPASFWGCAVQTYAYVRNRLPTSALSTGNSIPWSAWYNCAKPDVSHLRVFGCTAYVHVQKDQTKGLQPHTKKYIFIGYPSEYKGWMFWHLC